MPPAEAVTDTNVKLSSASASVSLAKASIILALLSCLTLILSAIATGRALIVTVTIPSACASFVSFIT